MTGIAIKRGIEIFKIEGFRGLYTHVKKRLTKHYSSAHLLVFVSNAQEIRSAATQAKGLLELSRRFTKSLDFKEIVAGDEAEIDELTAIDPWKFPKELTIQHLNKGCKCFVAKKDNRIIACTCAWITSSYYDEFLKFDYVLGPDEAYYWRAFCIPEFRGIGVLPRIMVYAIEDLVTRYNKTEQVSWVRATNKPMCQTLRGIGWRPVGRGGFVEMFGVRINYLWCSKGFAGTKKRLSLRFSPKKS